VTVQGNPKMPVLVPRLGKDTGVVSSVGQRECHVGIR
jgi:hypothetical protein